MSVSLMAEVFRNDKVTRGNARAGLIKPEWSGAWTVRLYHEERGESALGTGSTKRVAAMRAAASAVLLGFL